MHCEYVVTRLPSPCGSGAQKQLSSHLIPFLSAMLDHCTGESPSIDLTSVALQTFIAHTLYNYTRVCVGDDPPELVDALIKNISCGFSCSPCRNLVRGLLDASKKVKILEAHAVRQHLERRLKPLRVGVCGVTWDTDRTGKMHSLVVRGLFSIASSLYNVIPLRSKSLYKWCCMQKKGELAQQVHGWLGSLEHPAM
jgi:hypothetical protein